MSNRQGGPERVIDFVLSRLSGCDTNLEDAAPFEERKAIVQEYSHIAGYSADQLRGTSRIAASLKTWNTAAASIRLLKLTRRGASMTTGIEALAASLAISTNSKAAIGSDHGALTTEAKRCCVAESLARSSFDATLIAPIRHRSRAIASERGAGREPDPVKLLQPLVAQAHAILRERFEAGGSVEDYLRDRAKLADSTVVGLLHIASISTGLRSHSMVAPLGAVAVGGYGRTELAPGSDLDLLFLLPETSRACADGCAPATKACISAVVGSLWDLGFKLDHAVRSASECLELARNDATVLSGLLDRRFLWGGFGLFTSLDTAVMALLSGPDTGHWRHTVGSSLLSTGRLALCKMQGLEEEPDLKRSPGGLRDLQRAIRMNARGSRHSRSFIHPSLVDAHRFLWSVRCHLHLLAGRAEDRLSLSFQPGITRRLGLDASQRSAVPLLMDLVRWHRRSVLAAIGGPASAGGYAALIAVA
ncbi:[protein-PII] uridylyltransferase family protein [Bradyrhizobium sp. UFLA05-112]